MEILDKNYTDGEKSKEHVLTAKKYPHFLNY